MHNGRNGTDCASCHDDTSWAATDFNHWMVSGFALEGRHNALSCQSCHTVDLATALPETCIGCHAEQDVHNGLMGQNCASCHSQDAWIDTGFDHLSQTGFALTGVHADAGCADCHMESVTAALPNTCAGCHEPDPHQNQLGSDCAVCHGDFGEGIDRWPVLAGGFDTLGEERPEKTVGSYWPYLSTVYDYIRRAMPFGDARSLSNDDVYALTAYVLFLNDIVDDEEFELSNENFSEIKLPNEENFFADDRLKEPHYANTSEPCMSDCLAGEAKVTMRARVLDVTPDAEGESNLE